MPSDESSTPPGAVRITFRALDWFVLLVFGLATFATALSAGYVAATTCVAAGLLLMPSSRKLFRERTGIAMSAKMTAIGLAALFAVWVWAGVHGSLNRYEATQAAEKQASEARAAAARDLRKEKSERDAQYFQANSAAVLGDARARMAAGDVDGVLALASTYVEAHNAELEQLGASANERKNAELRKQTTKQLLADIDGLRPYDYQGRREKYAQLVNLNPDNKEYQSKLHFYAQRLTEQTQRTSLAAEQQKQIDEQFSAWDGSNKILTRVIKENMKNPDSYQHVRTTYVVKGTDLIVTTIYRGTNSFGAIVPSTVVARISLDGSHYKILAGP